MVVSHKYLYETNWLNLPPLDHRCSLWYTSMLCGNFISIYREKLDFEMYKSILITVKEAILLEQILSDYLKNESTDSINVHILIKHICGTKAQYDRNGTLVCGESTHNQL